jgi:hypothetical protein
MTNRPSLIGRSLFTLLLVLAWFGSALPKPSRAISSLAVVRDALSVQGIGSPNGGGQGTPFKSLPVRFELNAGQTDSQVRFTADTQSGVMFLTPTELVMKVFEPSKHISAKERRRSPEAYNTAPNSSVVHLRTVNANPAARITGVDPLPGTTNYFLGNDPKNWHTNVPSFARVKYENVYPGIDLIYYGNEGNLEYDFNVAPGADPKQIALSIDGADQVDMDEAGNLLLHTAVGIVSQHAPRIYQETQAGRREVPGGYVLRHDGLVAFDLVAYDRGKPLVIDPEVVYSTYFGGTASTEIGGIAVDANGSVYVVGATYSHDFPIKDPIQGTNNHIQNFSAIISKFSPDGQSLVYSTYLGGSSTQFTDHSSDSGLGIVLDSTNAAYITGLTNSTDFPTRNASQPTFGGADGAGEGENVFVAKISPDGSTLVYSTYLGGSGIDVPYSIALDSKGDAYLCGSTTSPNFPMMNPTQPSLGGLSMLGFLSVISPDGSQLNFSTYVGTGGPTYLQSLVVIPDTGDAFCSQASVPSSATSTSRDDYGVWPASAANNCSVYYYQYVGGDQGDPDHGIPPTPPKVEILGKQPFPCNSSDGGDTFVNDNFGRAFQNIMFVLSPLVFGNPTSMTSPDATAAPVYAGIMQMDPTTGNILSVQDVTVPIQPPSGVERDAQGAVYLTGSQPTSPAFPLVNPVQPAGGGGIDAYLTVFAPGTPQLVFSTYIGGSGDDFSAGIALDPQGNIYIAGTTDSPNFPTVNAYQSSPPAPNGIMVGQGNSFIVKISSLGTIPTGPDFSLALAESTVTASKGTKIPITVDISRIGGLTGDVTVTPPSPAPKGLKIQGGTISTTAATAAFHIKVKGSAQPGSYQLVFSGTDPAGQTHSATLTLTVQ